MRSWTSPDPSRIISARDAIARVALHGASLLDVRAEVEFQKGAVPGSTNLPILKDSEREKVGIQYKNAGKESAIGLGEALVIPDQPQRIAGWQAWAKAEASPILYCARGGMRSSITQNWLTTAGTETLRVNHGYKALRREFLDILEAPHAFLVLGGLTGSAKTLFLQGLAKESPAIAASFVDLETLANHKGSAFGKPLEGAQPTTHDFENMVAMQIFSRKPGKPILVEDESKTIGRVRIPNVLYGHITDAPLVKIELSLEERAEFLVEDYVLGPERKHGTARLRQFLLDSANSIREKLGDERHRKIIAGIEIGMDQSDRNAHLGWITLLLREYYDPMYAFAMEKKDRKEIFRGRPEDARAFLLDYYR